MFNLVLKKLGPYLTLKRLKEVNHLFDTQTNEAINELITQFSEKNRVFASSLSLAGRITFALIVHNTFLKRCLPFFWKKKGFLTSENNSYLNRKIIRNTYCKTYKCKPVTKKSRSMEKKLKHKVMIQKENKDLSIGITYRSGINLETEKEGEFFCMWMTFLFRNHT